MKVKRCYLRLVSCFVLGFCLIFSSTLHVNAASISNTITRTYTVSLYPCSSTVSVQTGNLTIPNNSYTISITSPQHNEQGSGRYTTSSAGYLSSYTTIVPAFVSTGTISPSSSSSNGVSVRLDEAEGCVYYSCPLSFDINYSDFPSTSYDSSYKYIDFSTWDFNASSSLGSFNNSQLTFNGESSFNSHYVSKSSVYFYSGGTNYLSPTLHVSGNFNYAYMSNSSRQDLANPISFNVTVTFRMNIRDVSNSVVSQNSPVVNDVQGNELQEQNNSISQDTNTVSHDTNTVTHGIFDKITAFFNAFFDNLIGVFVPESGFFQQWFSDLNSFMSQKLGFLWSPFDFVISFLNGIYSSSGGSSPGIVFPGLTWIDGTVIIPRQIFSFDNIGGESFSDLRDMIYFATDVILLGAVVHQFYQKIKIVFEGGSD